MEMSDNCLFSTVGYMAYYTFKPFLICHAILSTAWKAARMVKGLAAENATYSAEQASLVLPIFRTRTHERPLSVTSQNHERPVSVMSQTHERPVSVMSQTHERPLSARYPSGYSLDLMLQQQLAEIEAEKDHHQRWSRLPSYSLYDENAETPPSPPLSPGDFNFSRKPSYGGVQYKNDIRIMVYPVEKQSLRPAISFCTVAQI